jgi:hypothetical protein
MGRQCTSLPVLLRVAALDQGSRSGDHEATWLLGHTERISFGALWRDHNELYADAVLHVPCRYLQEEGDGRARCEAHGYTGSLPPQRPEISEPRRQPADRFRIVEAGRLVTRHLSAPLRSTRELPIHAGTNPCVGAPCRTADNRRGAACCRDLQIEIMCTTKQHRLEALVRARKSPYLCKVDRESPYSLGAEMISSCEFLADDGIHCALHGRKRADGRPAKPDLCSHWPEGEDTLHPGCVFAKAGMANSQ